MASESVYHHVRSCVYRHCVALEGFEIDVVREGFLVCMPVPRVSRCFEMALQCDRRKKPSEGWVPHLLVDHALEVRRIGHHSGM